MVIFLLFHVKVLHSRWCILEEVVSYWARDGCPLEDAEKAKEVIEVEAMELDQLQIYNQRYHNKNLNLVVQR